MNSESRTNASTLVGTGNRIRPMLLAADSDGRIDRTLARQLVSFCKAPASGSGGLEPERLFGPFDSQPRNVRLAMIRAIEEHDKWAMLGHELGSWHMRLVRFLWNLKFVYRKYGFNRLSALSGAAAHVVQGSPAYAIHHLHRWWDVIQGAFSPRPHLSSVFSRIGLDPRDLAVCYTRAISQREGYAGFSHDPQSGKTIGVMVGLDLLPGDEGFWFIESNLNFGTSETRARLYERDPLVTSLVEFAAAYDYKHIVIMMSPRMSDRMCGELGNAAKDRGLRLTVIDDGYISGSDRIQSYRLPPISSDKTLVVRTKCYRTSLDYLFQHKKASAKALMKYKDLFPSDDLLIPYSGVEPVITGADATDPFPNLVYKYPERDEGRGVFFLKARSTEHAYSIVTEITAKKRSHGLLERIYSAVVDQTGIFQTFVRPRMLEGRRLYKIRAHVLISPVGVHYLSAHRVLSAYGVPESLPFGLVTDPRPYLVNLSSSSSYEKVSGFEEVQIMKSALAVAEGLQWAAAYGFTEGAPEATDLSNDNCNANGSKE